jgi:hypothetical protein
MMGSANASDQDAKVLRGCDGPRGLGNVIRPSNRSAKQLNSGCDGKGSDGVYCIQVSGLPNRTDHDRCHRQLGPLSEVSQSTQWCGCRGRSRIGAGSARRCEHASIWTRFNWCLRNWRDWKRADVNGMCSVVSRWPCCGLLFAQHNSGGHQQLNCNPNNFLHMYIIDHDLSCIIPHLYTTTHAENISNFIPWGWKFRHPTL